MVMKKGCYILWLTADYQNASIIIVVYLEMHDSFGIKPAGNFVRKKVEKFAYEPK